MTGHNADQWCMWVEEPLAMGPDTELHILFDNNLSRAASVRRLGAIIEATIELDDGTDEPEVHRIFPSDGPFQDVAHAKTLAEQTLQLTPRN